MSTKQNTVKQHNYSPAEVLKIRNLADYKGKERTKKISILAKQIGVNEKSLIQKFYALRRKDTPGRPVSNRIQLQEQLQIEMRLPVTNIRLESTATGIDLVFSVKR